MTAFNPDGTNIFTNIDGVAWATPQTFTATQTGTVRIRILQLGPFGTFRIAYAVGATAARPPAQVPLQPNTWVTASTTDGAAILWFRMDVTAGNTYRIWWNDQGQGTGTMTRDIQLTAHNPDGTIIFNQVNHGWTTPQTFTATQTGTVRLAAGPQGVMLNRTGNFQIVYSTGTIRPSL